MDFKMPRTQKTTSMDRGGTTPGSFIAAQRGAKNVGMEANAGAGEAINRQKWAPKIKTLKRSYRSFRGSIGFQAPECQMSNAAVQN